jgi:hypothetical protein
MSLTTFFASLFQTGASILMLSYGKPVDSQQIKTEIGPSDPKVSIHVKLTRYQDDLIVTGSVRPKSEYGDPPTWRKIEIDVLAPNGKIISKSSERWILVPESSPRPYASTQQWPFQIRFHGMPKAGSAVRVTALPV